MVPWAEAPVPVLAEIHTIITDVDDTLTHRGRLDGATLDALARLRQAGIRVIPATAASAGWGSLMAAMWPVDAVIAENGGVGFVRDGDGVRRHFLAGAPPDLPALARAVRTAFPHLHAADDQPYREASLAFRRLPDPAANRQVLAALPSLGAGGGTVNSLWLLAFPGQWDKLTASRRLLAEQYGQTLADEQARILYVGDSDNDQSMFAALPHTVGVATVADHDLDARPRWVTQGPGGAGFVEVAGRVLAARGMA